MEIDEIILHIVRRAAWPFLVGGVAQGPQASI